MRKAIAVCASMQLVERRRRRVRRRRERTSGAASTCASVPPQEADATMFVARQVLREDVGAVAARVHGEGYGCTRPASGQFEQPQCLGELGQLPGADDRAIGKPEEDEQVLTPKLRSLTTRPK